MEGYELTVQRTAVVFARAELQRIDTCRCCIEVRMRCWLRQPFSAAAINRGLYDVAHGRSRLRGRSGLSIVTRCLVGIG